MTIEQPLGYTDEEFLELIRSMTPEAVTAKILDMSRMMTQLMRELEVVRRVLQHPPKDRDRMIALLQMATKDTRDD